MNNVDEFVQEILNEGFLMSLGTFGEDGVWVADVVYISDKNCTIYWLSSEKARHSQNIVSHSQTAATITLDHKSSSLQITGTAKKLDEYSNELANMYSTKRKKPLKTEEEMRKEGKTWYQLSPTRIEMTYEPVFGFKKQIITF